MLLNTVKALVREIIPERQLRKIRRIRSRWGFIRRFGLRYYRMSSFKLLDGWLIDQEALELFGLARSLSESSPVVVEIGSWCGKSSVVIAMALLGKKQPRLCCIDPFDEMGDPRCSEDHRFSKSFRLAKGYLGGSPRTKFDENVQSLGVGDVITVYQGYSHDLAETWRDKLDLVFIDGNHNYDAVRQDFLDWSRFIKPGGFIAFHDVWFPDRMPSGVDFNPGPGEVVKELVLPNPAWATHSYTCSLFVAQREPAAEPCR